MKQTKLQQFCEKWKNGCGNEICSSACSVVLFRGVKIPADIVFVGEAPGLSEDSLGKPFVGPAGKLLDIIIASAVPNDISYAITNLVGCLPTSLGSGDIITPTPTEMLNCKLRLEEFLTLCSPRLIVAVGSYARDSLHGGYRYSPNLPLSVVDVIDITHPAAMLRAEYSRRPLMIQKAVVTISEGINNTFKNGVDHQ